MGLDGNTFQNEPSVKEALVIKAKKEKPKYNVWQNSGYVLKKMRERDKSLLWIIGGQIFLAVAISTTAMFLPKAVVSLIISGGALSALVMVVLAFSLSLAVMQMAEGYLELIAQPRKILQRMRICIDIFDKAVTTDYANLEEKAFKDAKQKAHNMTNNNSSSTEQIYNCFTALGKNILGFVVYVLLLVSVNPWVLLITAVTTILGVLARNQANKWRYDHDEEQAAYDKRLWYISSIGSEYEIAKDIRLFTMTGWLKDIYESNLRLAYDFNRRAQLRQLAADVVDVLTAFLREGIAYAYLIMLVLNAGLPVDEFVLLFAAIGGFSGWIAGILGEYTTLSRYSLEYNRLREYLEYPDRFHRAEGEPIEAETGKEYALTLHNVSFRYDGASENTLENINLTIKAGEKLAIVGLNGAGKTTLVKLLCGLYDPTEGEVLLNGQDIRRYNRKQYYQLFTAVFQEFNLLPLSITVNIAQQFEDEANLEKINQCLKLADLDKKIKSLPNGLSSLLLKNVNEDAVELSGGETQKLMLARALYKESPILILDEPTAALDPIAESSLYQRYNDLSAGKTSLYISHRLASTRFCDRIVLIGNKTISEIGTHDELLKQGGAYAELYEIQSKYYRNHAEQNAETFINGEWHHTTEGEAI